MLVIYDQFSLNNSFPIISKINYSFTFFIILFLPLISPSFIHIIIVFFSQYFVLHSDLICFNRSFFIMSTNRYYRSANRNMYSSSSHANQFSSTHNPTQHRHSTNHVIPHPNSLLRLPNFSEDSSLIANSRESVI